MSMPHADPLVSVVIPARDAVDYLPDALRSAQAQTLREIEILVVDDGSRDGTWAVLRDAAASDRRIKPLRRLVPGGVSAARNAAIAHARGRWIALLDADDLWLPQRLARLVPRAERLGADLLADDLQRVDFQTGASLGRHLGPVAIAEMEQPLTLEGLVAHDMPDASPGTPRAIGYLKPLLRRDFVLRRAVAFDEALTIGEDLAFFVDCVAHGGRFYLVDEAFYLYRERSRSLSRRPGLARMQARANGRMIQAATQAGQQGALALLRRRQDLLDQAALADEAARGAWLSALAQARWARPRILMRDLRVVAGAARRRLPA